ncbi:hypothetical protein GN244_ATG14281 [Phytophthora infestans]|uniref:Uncharacterized protein n=1 Tax=Phytophthora infestans TaxID=4787 RepID=A0A833W8J9_PHYIN|nr:hypothetical protein GN244_ATG14281 [Phytophthora infestans]
MEVAAYKPRRSYSKVTEKCYVSPSARAGLNIRHPVIEKRLFDWIVDIREKKVAVCFHGELADGVS